MADTTELRMNVAALKRVDPYARDIVDSATHVALYTFEDNEWEKTSIEGALFVYSRNGEPYHSMVIMNRLNTSNLIEPVAQGLELQLQEPFLLYRNSRCHIYGIWFYDKDECVRVALKLNTLVKDSVKYQSNNETTPSALPASTPNTSGAVVGGVDIFSMLSKAQDDYNSNKGAVINKTDNPGPRAPDLTSQSVMDFFAKAGSGASQMPVAPTSQASGLFGVPRPPAGDVRDAPLLLQRLMSNPAHSVEHIEKQQRSVTPQETSFNNGSIAHDMSLRQSNCFKLKGVPSGDKRHESSQKHDSQPPRMIVAKSNKSQVHLNSAGESSDVNGQIQLENDLGFMCISSPKPNSPLASFLSQPQDSNHLVSVQPTEMKPLAACVNNTLDTPQKPALMPPTMFTSSASKASDRQPQLDSALTPIRQPVEDIRPEPLTRNQLMQAFNYLIKHDADFVNKLHEAYVKSFSELVS